MILDLLHKDRQELKTESLPFDFNELTNDSYDPVELFQNLKDTMIHNRGTSLSAPQCGISLRVFVMGNWNDPDSVAGVFNPKIVAWSDNDLEIEEEQCLTFPGLYVKMKRYSTIRARYTTQNNVTDTIRFGGLTSKIFQHQVDLLNGILYTKKANKFHLEQAINKKKKLDKLRNKNMGRVA